MWTSHRSTITIWLMTQRKSLPTDFLYSEAQRWPASLQYKDTSTSIRINQLIAVECHGKVFQYTHFETTTYWELYNTVYKLSTKVRLDLTFTQHPRHSSPAISGLLLQTLRLSLELASRKEEMKNKSPKLQSTLTSKTQTGLRTNFTNVN